MGLSRLVLTSLSYYAGPCTRTGRGQSPSIPQRRTSSPELQLPSWPVTCSLGKSR